jgi:seryl-tRNA synthetase
MEQRHARTVQIEVDRERVQWEAALREEGRSGRQLGNQMKHLAEEQTQLREQWEEASKARNALLKDVGRERRQHDVEKQTWLEKCNNLEAALGLLNKKEDARKRQHQTAMAKADSLCGQIRVRLGVLEKEAGQLAWQRKKHRQLVARESASVEINKWSVKRKEIQVARQQEMITKRQDAVVGKEVVLRSKLGKVAALKQVFLALGFLFVCFPYRDHNCQDVFAAELSGEDGCGKCVATIVVSTEQANE